VGSASFIKLEGSSRGRTVWSVQTNMALVGSSFSNLPIRQFSRFFLVYSESRSALAGRTHLSASTAEHF